MIFRLLSRRRRARRRSLAALLAACAAIPASAAAMPADPGDAGLTPRLAELAQPAVRTLPAAVQAERLGVPPAGPGSLVRLGGRVLVDVRFDAGAIAGLDPLRAAGAEVLASSRRYQTVTVAVAPGQLGQLADVAGVEGVSERRAPLLAATDGPSAAAAGVACEGGAVVSEGIGQLNVAAARSATGLDGSGVTVGVLSDSYDKASLASDGSGPIATRAEDDVESSDLPGTQNPCPDEMAPVRVLEDYAGSGPSDEGRAMLQIVHDVAPGASLAFATAFLSELSFAQNIEDLARPVASGGAGADVIVDDVIWFEEPFFQDGPVAVAASKVTGEGVPYFSSAGNSNLFEGENEIASWEAPAFRDGGSCPLTVTPLLPGPGSAHCMDFDPGAGTDLTFGIAVSSGATLNLDLQWAEPWFGVDTDLDAYLLDAGGTVVGAEESDNVGATQRPVEVLQWKNTAPATKTVRLVVNRCAGECNPAAAAAAPTVKFALLQNGGGVIATEYPQSAGGDVVGPTIFGHAAAPAAIAVAAVPFDDDAQVEPYSSRGPVTQHFGPVNGTSPAPPLPAPTTIAKPDVAATDCGATTFFAFLAGDGEWRFCGTSAAAPHAAGVAALQLDADPAATVAEIRTGQTSTARPVDSFGPEAAGAGLLDANAAIGDLPPTGGSTVQAAPPDTIPPRLTLLEGPPARSTSRRPAFVFAAGEPAEFVCAIDDAIFRSCASPFVSPVPLEDGDHAFEVLATDAAGNTARAGARFAIDTRSPETFVRSRPRAVLSTRRATIRASLHFGSDEAGVTFSCRIDRGTPRICGPRLSRRYRVGRHVVRVTARDELGNVDATAAVVRFRVKRLG